MIHRRGFAYVFGLKKMSSLRSGLGFKIIIWLYKIKNWIDFKCFKKALYAETLLMIKLQLQMRLLYEDAKSIGYDKHFDKCLMIAALKICRSRFIDRDVALLIMDPLPDQLQDRINDNMNRYTTNQEDVNKVIEKVMQSQAIVDTLCSIFSVELFKAIKHGSAERICFYKRLIEQSHGNNIIEINTYRHLAKLCQGVKNNISNLKSQIADKESLKLSVSPQGVGAILSIITSTFLLGGFVHNWYILGHFGIDVSRYFVVSDYLSSAVEAIRWAAIGSLLSAVGLFSGLVRASRQTYAEALSTQRKTNLYLYLLSATAIANSIIVYFTNFQSFYKSLSIIAGFVVLIIADKAANRFFKEPILPLIVMVFVGSFFASLFSNARTEIYLLENKLSNNVGSVSFNGTTPFTEDEAHVITMNSGFIFIMDKNKNIYVLPRQRFEYARVTPKL